MILRRRPSAPAALRDRSRALMQRAAEAGADLTSLDREAESLRTELAELRSTTPGDEDATALLDEADRYLQFVGAMANPPADEAAADPLVAAARAMDADVLAAAREVAAGRKVDEARVLALRERMDELVARARAANRLTEIQQVLHDAHLDLTYVDSGGVAPTSVRLAHERPLGG